MSALFAALLSAGVNSPLSIFYVPFVYLAATTTIVGIGLCIYLAVTKSLGFRRLVLGFGVIVLVLAPCEIGTIFIPGMQSASVVHYLITWMPPFVALSSGILVATH